MVMRLANSGLNNEDQLQALKYAKDSLREEVERSKAMIKAFLINNKSDYPLFKENVTIDTNEEKTEKVSLFGFIKEEDINFDDDFSRTLFF